MNIDRPPSTYDLHLHTSWSYDATASPERYFKRAGELGIRCLAITEHHVLDSLPQVREVAKRFPEIRVIPAAELSVTTSFGAIDLLCYGFPSKTTEAVQEVLEHYHTWQRACGSAVSEGMQAIGFDYTDQRRCDLLKSYRPAEAIDLQGVTHVKNQRQLDFFLAEGYIRDETEYRPLLERAAREVPPPPYPAVDEVVPAVQAAGVLVAIAHPFGYFGGTDRDRMDALTEECRLDGIECAHLKVPVECSPIYRAYCEEKGLFSVAGTDCHSDEDIEELLTCHGGKEKWLDEFLERLEEK
ncbi:MAG: hypothetical protein DRP71_01755 [Verrucomicrobia bacterium]|nr:MAG: hypothetical protein DRP71_01755 [Verrucomicrobiota bacterium]